MNLGDIGSVDEKPDVSKYGDENFWRARYNEEKLEDFEWFVSLKECMNQNAVFKQLLMSRVKQKVKILEIGCGTSTMSKDLYDLGFRDICGIDYQEKAVEFQRVKAESEKTEINFEVMDLTSLTFDDSTFDVVVDKGTFDALMCKSESDLHKGAAEVWRVMKKKDTSMLIVLSNAPLMDLIEILKKYFEVGMNSMVKNERLNQAMAKLYVMKARKKIRE